MNIVMGILKYPPDYAGDGLRFHRMFQRLKKAGEIGEVHVITSWDRGQKGFRNELRDGVQIHRVVENTGKKKYQYLGGFLKTLMIPLNMIRILRCYFPLWGSTDLVMTSGSGWLPSLVGWLAFLTGKPLIKEIVLLQSDDPLTVKRKKGFFSWPFTLPFHFARLVVTISPPLKKACMDYGLAPEKIWCRLNPVDFPIVIKKEECEACSGVPAPEVPTVLWVGTIKHRKNVDFLLSAGAFLKPPVRLVFAGPFEDAAYYARLLEMARNLPRGIDVIFAGEVEDREKLIALYREAKVFWFASHKEGMGNVVAEALICGTPVVSLPVLGIMPYVIPTSEDGEVVEEESPAQFAAAVNRWLAACPDRCAIAARAREHFNTAKVDQGYLSWFYKITRHKPASHLPCRPEPLEVEAIA